MSKRERELYHIEVRILDAVGREQASFKIEQVTTRLTPVGLVAMLDHWLRKMFKESPDFGDEDDETS